MRLFVKVNIILFSSIHIVHWPSVSTYCIQDFDICYAYLNHIYAPIYTFLKDNDSTYECKKVTNEPPYLPAILIVVLPLRLCIVYLPNRFIFLDCVFFRLNTHIEAHVHICWHYSKHISKCCTFILLRLLVSHINISSFPILALHHIYPGSFL